MLCFLTSAAASRDLIKFHRLQAQRMSHELLSVDVGRMRVF